MAFPQVEGRNQGQSSGNQTSHTVNLPAGVQVGELLQIYFSVDNAANVITWPAGWTELFQAAVGGGGSAMGGVAEKVADGTEGASVIVITSISETSCNLTQRVSAFGGASECGVAVAGSGTTPDPPSFTPSWGAIDTLWMPCAMNDGWTIVTAYPTDYVNGQHRSYEHGIAGVGVSTAERELAAASEDPGVFTLQTGYGWVANTVAIQPLSEPPPATGLPPSIGRVIRGLSGAVRRP